jgi:hypothetical protein
MLNVEVVVKLISVSSCMFPNTFIAALPENVVAAVIVQVILLQFAVAFKLTVFPLAIGVKNTLSVCNGGQSEAVSNGVPEGEVDQLVGSVQLVLVFPTQYKSLDVGAVIFHPVVVPIPNPDTLCPEVPSEHLKLSIMNPFIRSALTIAGIVNSLLYSLLNLVGLQVFPETIKSPVIV